MAFRDLLSMGRILSLSVIAAAMHIRLFLRIAFPEKDRLYPEGQISGRGSFAQNVH